MLLIVGRTGSGKDYLKKLLQDNGISFVKTYTTRQKRFPDEDTYNFVSIEDANKIADKVAVTEIRNGAEPDLYFARSEDVLKNDAIVVDPRGVNEILRKYPEETFVIIYITANAEKAKEMAVKRANNDAEAGIIFEKRSKDENDEFAEFEMLLKHQGYFEGYNNVAMIAQVTNDYCEETMKQVANNIVEFQQQSKMGNTILCV